MTLLIALSCTAYTQTESERKFVLNDFDSISNLIRNHGQIGPFGFHYHAEYYYLDIYFDTPQSHLQKHQLSLRMRIQNRPGLKDSLRYTFQLKTEMTTPGAPRLEMEETELDFYLLQHQGATHQLDQFLTLFFQESANDAADFSPFLFSFSHWFKQKAGAPLAPFQGLRFLYPQVFTENVIASLTPVCYGAITRTRAHVYLKDSDATFDDVRNKERSLNDIPEFFVLQQNLIWLMELSLDNAVFYDINNPNKRCVFSELEVESKFDERSLKQGNILALFADVFLAKFEAKEEIRSKFKQVMDCLQAIK